MVMDQSWSGLYTSVDGTGFNEDSVLVLPSQDLINGGDKLQEPILDQNDIDILPISPHSSCNNLASWPYVEKDPYEVCDFGDAALKYVSQMLMEEDIEDRNCMFQESLALEATEKLFYDIIREEYLPPDDHQTATFIKEYCCNPDEMVVWIAVLIVEMLLVMGTAWNRGPILMLESISPLMLPRPTSQSSFSSSSSPNRVPNMFNDSESVLQVML